MEHGFVFTPEAVREGEERWTPLLRERLRVQRRGKAGRSWYLEELSRAIDRAGHWVDSLRSAARETRDRKVVQRFFRSARAGVGWWATLLVGHTPDRVTMDRHEAYPRILRKTLGSLAAGVRSLSRSAAPGCAWLRLKAA